MWLGGDPEAIRHAAARLRALGDTLATHRATAQRRLSSVHWESAAADAFRAQSVHDFAAYGYASASLDEVAIALDHLAATLSHRQHALIDLAARAGRTIEDVWSDAGHALDDLTGGFL